MHEIIVGGAGTGKTCELLRRYKGSQNALFLSQKGITPYKLALDIVTAVEGKVPEFERTLSTGEKRSVFSSKKEYELHLSIGAPISLCGEVMKSFGEIEIANFLFESKIDYIYEHPYKHDTRTEKYAQYRPDFYLPDYDVYIEYFALDRSGKAPSYFDEGYAEKEKWKIALHEKMGTRLIALYAYERGEGVLISSLKAKLKREKIKLRHKRRSELYPKKAEYTEMDGGEDFTPILKKAREYAKKGAHRCPFSRIFVDDIDLWKEECTDFISSLSLPVTATTRDTGVAVYFEGARITELTNKFRTPSYDFVFSHTKENECVQIFSALDRLEKNSHVYVIGKNEADAKMLASPLTSLSYDREQRCVRISYAPRCDLGIIFAPAHVVEGGECDDAIVLADNFDACDKRAFETAVTRAKKSVCIISKTGAESPLARAFRESLGTAQVKKGFSCPKCAGELSYAKGKYGEYLRCSCGYKRNM